MEAKKWTIRTLCLLISVLIFISAITVIIDPFFHYHKPLSFLQYPFFNERYINDGITKHFEYDSIITGTSMTQNFKTSEFDKLWNTESIKVSFSGASYKEVNDILTQAFSKNSDIKYVLRSLDYSYLLKDKDHMRFDFDYYPRYLYDKNPFNDVKYILNKAVFKNDLEVLMFTKNGNHSPTFDEYGNWYGEYTFGKEAILKDHIRADIKEEQQLTSDQKLIIEDSIRQNVLSLTRKHPNTTFYLFFTPYSILYWDSLKRGGTLDLNVEAEKTAIELLINEKNIQLYSFTNNFELTCNLDNYKDVAHYSQDVNSQILKWIKNGDYRITKSNYLGYLDEIRNYYNNYDYDSIYE